MADGITIHIDPETDFDGIDLEVAIRESMDLPRKILEVIYNKVAVAVERPEWQIKRSDKGADQKDEG
jgi:hypothetical protein